MKRLLMLLLLTIILAQTVSALQITPAKFEYQEYTPGEYKELSLNVFNDIQREVIYEITFEGYEDNFEIISHESNRISVKPTQTETVTVSMLFPELEEFGKVRFTLIRVYQVPDRAGQVGATVALKIPVDTYVPYPDKFLRIHLEDPGVVKQGETAQLEADVTSLGLEPVRDIIGEFRITNGDQQREVPIEPIPLMVLDETVNVQAAINTGGLTPGPYNASLHLNYQGGSKDSKNELLVVGSEEIEIIDVKPRSFVNSSVNDLEMIFLNLWVNTLASDISVDLLTAQEEKIKGFDVGRFSMPVGSYHSITTNLDLSDQPAGDYVLRINSDYKGDVKQKNFNIKVETKPVAQLAPEKTPMNLTLILAIGLGITIILLIIIIIILLIRRRRDDDEE